MEVQYKLVGKNESGVKSALFPFCAVKAERPRNIIPHFWHNVKRKNEKFLKIFCLPEIKNFLFFLIKLLTNALFRVIIIIESKGKR